MVQRGDCVAAGYARIVHKQHQRIAFACFRVFWGEQVVAHGFAGGFVGKLVLGEVVKHFVEGVRGVQRLAADLHGGFGGFERGRGFLLFACFARAVFGGIAACFASGAALFDGKQRGGIVGVEREGNVSP